MPIRLQDQKTWWDSLLGRPFKGPSVRLNHDPQLLDYNSSYHTVLTHLHLKDEPADLIRTFRADGLTSSYQNQLEVETPRWLQSYLSEFMRYETRPWFIVNGDCDVMARLKFTGEELQALKSREIAVYFYEPVIPREGPFFYRRSEKTRFYELQWLEDFNNNHGGDLKIVAYVCDYELGEYLRKWNLYPSIDVRTLDIFVGSFVHGLYPIPKADVFKTMKKFICPNFRYAGFRELVVGYLFGANFAKDGHISFFHRNENPEKQPYRYPFPLQSLPQWPVIKQGLEKMKPVLPLTLETTNSAVFPVHQPLPDWDGLSNRRNHKLFSQFYNDSCVSLVNETRYGVGHGVISEKTLLPIYYLKPFVMIGGPHMLKYLKELGFETFEKFWDESYDAIEDPAKRMEAIFALLKDLLSRPLEDLQRLLVDMDEILSYNRHHLENNFLHQMHSQIAFDAKVSRGK